MNNNLQRVVTITLNPAIDLTAYVPEFHYGHVNAAKQQGMQAAGKGINVAKVLASLGAEVTVTGFLGRENEALFKQLFAEMAITDAFIRVQGATRTNVKLVDAQQSVTDINLSGLHICAQALYCLEKQLLTLAEDHDIFIFAGSLPGGVAPRQLTKWIQLLKHLGKKVFFDSSGQVLTEGVAAIPYLIKPNIQELAVLTDKPLLTHDDIVQAARALAKTGIEHVIVSLGDRGLIWVQDQHLRYAKPPQMTVVSTVGAGDTLVAGFCWGIMQRMDSNELLTFATALSALSVQEVGVVNGKTDAVQLLQAQVAVEEIQYNNKDK